MNRAYVLLIVVVGILATALALILLLSLLPWLWLIGGVVAVAIAVVAIAGAIYLIKRLDIDLAHRSAMAEIASVVHLGEHGGYLLQAGKIEPLHPASVYIARGRTIVEADEEPEPQKQTLLASPHVRQPSMNYLLSELEPGALQVAPGVRADTGELVILSIEDAVHFKLIGSSGFGKSCEAAALLEQAITLNTPDLLQIALLDLEHKTSRLFENSPNVATLQVGRRSVPMVATNADEVATYLGYLKSELDRRAHLSETDLQAEPILLMYVEEMLSLQYEVVDAKLLSRMLADLSVLAIRARKYRMFLLACAQTDYSTPELKTAQKQFRTRIAYAIDTTAARAAGFMSTDLIKYNFVNSQKGDGQFVLESPGIAALMLAPVYDVRQKLLARERSTRPNLSIVNDDRTASERPLNDTERSLQAKAAQVAELRALQWGKEAIIKKVWGAKKGGNKAYVEAEAEFEQIVSQLEEQEA